MSGLFALCLGLLMLPVGIGAAVLASRRGVPRRAVAFRITMLLANIAVAVACWKTGTFLSDLQIVRITNASSEAIGPMRVWIEPALAPIHALEIERLGGGETHTWVLRYSNEGAATFWCAQGTRTIEAQEDDRVFLGIGQPMEVTLEIHEQGEYALDGVFARLWSWLAVLWP